MQTMDMMVLDVYVSISVNFLVHDTELYYIFWVMLHCQTNCMKA